MFVSGQALGFEDISRAVQEPRVNSTTYETTGRRSSRAEGAAPGPRRAPVCVHGARVHVANATRRAGRSMAVTVKAWALSIDSHC